MLALKWKKCVAGIYFATNKTFGGALAVTNANGNIIARQNFDAWGRRRKVQDYSYLPQNTASTDNGLNNNGTLPQWLYRGYTGHEMLDEFTLINMNARLYDQVLGLFLSPDKYISDPNNTQGYNRYAYCLNNPLKYTDPSGNIASLIAARNFSEGVNWMNERMNGNKNYNYDHQFVMTGQMSNTWRNDPSIVRGPNGLPMGPNGELSAFGDYGQSLEYSGNAGRKPYTDATGLNWRLQHEYIGEVETRIIKDKDGKIITDANGNMVSAFVETGNLMWIGSSYQPVGEDPNAWGSDFRGLEDAQGGGGSDGGLGNWLSGFDIAAGAYSEYGHNHTTYKTTKGIEKNIFKANGQIRSARAAGFARASGLVRGVAVVGSIASTAYSGYKVYNQVQTGGIQNVNGWDATDAGVGIIGLGATGAVYLGLISNPVGWVIGAGVLIYSGSRLAYDLYNEP